MSDLASDASVPGLDDVRVLDGPNLYFTRPAIKMTFRPTVLDELSRAQAEAFAPHLGRGFRRTDVGEPGSEQRLFFAARAVEATMRAIARGAGTTRLGIRSRPDVEERTVVTVFPWRRLRRAKALARATAWVLADPVRIHEPDRAIAEAVRWLTGVPHGDGPIVSRPRIPTVCITGTNGKTTVTRMVAHIAAQAGHCVSWCTSDGVYCDGDLVEAGDLTGFVGARTAVTAPGATFAVIEAARGGLLRRGLGVAAVDVGVLTNVSADHLGLGGINTLDQLAELKGTVLRAARRAVVVNAEDPRVLAMRTRAPATPWAFALDPAAPGLRHVLDEGGRALTVIDGCMTLLGGGGPTAIVSVADVPMTIGGLSRHNVANALAAAAAALAADLPTDAVAAGLTSFEPSPDLNPGRLNLWDVDGRLVIVDYGHNEEGLRALLEVADGLRRRGNALRLVLNAVGDRTDEVLEAMGELAGRTADHVVLAERASALRGRTPEELWGTVRRGLAVVGVVDVAGFPTEVHAVAAVLADAAPGDVCAVMAHDERDQVFESLRLRGGRVIDAATAVASAAACVSRLRPPR